MTLTVVARTGLSCSHCSDARIAFEGNVSVVVVEQDGYGAALCRPCAESFMGREKLQQVLHPAPESDQERPAAELEKAAKSAKKKQSRLYRAPSQEQRSA